MCILRNTRHEITPERLEILDAAWNVLDSFFYFKRVWRSGNIFHLMDG